MAQHSSSTGASAVGSPSDRRTRDLDEDTHTAHDNTPTAHDKFGGINWGAAFFGCLVAIAMTVLLTAIIGAIAGAVGAASDLTQTRAQREAGTVGIATALAVIIVMLLAYFAGGYVGGRMSRFDGGKQGLAVWLIGFVVTLVAVGLGVAFGTQYNILDRAELPRIPVPVDAATTAGIITAVVIIVGTCLAAMFGGKTGQRYHKRVDRAGGTDAARAGSRVGVADK